MVLAFYLHFRRLALLAVWPARLGDAALWLCARWGDMTGRGKIHWNGVPDADAAGVRNAEWHRVDILQWCSCYAVQ